MKKRLFPASLLALAIGALLQPALAHSDEATAWRLFVADHDRPVVNVIDAADGDTIDRFTLQGPATLYRSESGETVFAVQGSADTVAAIASGIAFHDHGDHGDIDIEPPKLLNTAFSGSKPAHFVERQGKVAQWFDKQKSAMLFTEQAVLANKKDVQVIDVVAPHHGVAVPFDHYAVVTIPNPEDASKRPVGARVVDLAGNKVGEDIACPGLHGSAGSGNIYALACEKGLLLITQQGKAPEIKLLPYSPSLPQGSASTLIGGKGLQYFIGNYGPDRIVLIDPAEAESFRLVQLPTRRVHFAVDPLRAKFAYVITEDGQLHQIDVVKGKITQSLKVTEPYSMDGHWNDPRPRIAVAGDKIVVTDPLNSQLQVINAVDFKPLAAIKVAGKPFNIVAVGGSGQVHGDHHEEKHQ